MKSSLIRLVDSCCLIVDRLYGFTLLQLVVSVSLFFYGCSNSNNEYIQRIQKIQEQQKTEFLNPLTSPLDSLEIKELKGIAHFPVDENFLVNAKIMWLPYTGTFEMPHTNDRFKPYTKAAELYFSINGKDYILTAFQNEKMRTQRTLFVPFADETNGHKTYGGGRFIDVNYAPNASEVEIDFNLCYYPYCAYSHRFTCPIVPKENVLNLTVNAGECYPK